MAKFSIMDHTGHTELDFDVKTKDGVSEAMKKFDELVKGHNKERHAGTHIAAAVYPNGEKKVVKAFDPNAQETIFIPKLKGG